MAPDLKQLWHYVDHWASIKPDAEALVFGALRMTWAELADAVDRTARALLDLGVQKGDCVALICTARPEFIITFMAATKISAIWTGISPRFTIGEMGRILRECRPTVLIALDRFEKTNLIERALTFSFELSCIREVIIIGNTSQGLVAFDEFIGEPRDHLTDALTERIDQSDPEDEALLMFTSGSSGFPKGVLHTHHSILCNVEQEKELFNMSENSRILLHFPINHVAADVEIGYCAIYAGACLVMLDGFEAEKALDIIDRESITLVGQVPAMYMLEMRSTVFEKTRWDSVETFVWGGSSASRDMLEVLDAIRKRTGAVLVTGYGATELGGFVTATRKDESVDALRDSVGFSYGNCEIRIVDEHRNPVSSGTIGEVAVRGPVLMKGYLNNPALTTDSMDEEGWYYTNDLGSMDATGLLTLHGRRSEMFKTGGENVYPCEIEAVLEAYPAVLYAGVVATPDDVFDEVCHAHIMVVPGAEVAEEELLNWCAKQLSQFKVPRRVFFHDTLPLLPNGKVDKKRLRAVSSHHP